MHSDLIERLEAPFTPEQVHNLNEYQRTGVMHPFTCQDSAHGPLIATCDGWICRNLDCDYTQDWAHSWPRGALAGRGTRESGRAGMVQSKRQSAQGVIQ